VYKRRKTRQLSPLLISICYSMKSRRDVSCKLVFVKKKIRYYKLKDKYEMNKVNWKKIMFGLNKEKNLCIR
jgi:hypothetical protein